MGLSQADIAEIESLLAGEVADATARAELRRRFPCLSVTRCAASDLGAETPFRKQPGFSLYLVDGRDHCWRLTDDPDCATGLVIVRHEARP